MQFLCIDAWICVLVLAVAYTCVGDAAVLQPLCAISSGATLERREAISLELCNCKPQGTQASNESNMLFMHFSIVAL